MLGDKARFLSTLSQQYGWGYTRFDYQGHGQSDGVFEHCSLHDWLGDALAVVDQTHNNHMQAEIGHQKIVLVGSSMGAWLASHVLLQRPSTVAALVTVAAAPDFTQRLLWPALSKDQQAGITRGECISLPSRYDEQNWRVSNTLFKSGRDLLLLDNNTDINVDIPVRMLHGTADVDVPWKYSQLLLEKFCYTNDAALQLIRGADHRLSDEVCLNHLRFALEDVVKSL